MLEGNTVVVSGAGRGLGRRIAAAAVREGGQVVLAARREENLRTIAREVDPSGRAVAVEPADITRADDCERVVRTAVDRFGRLDGLVNTGAAGDALVGGSSDLDVEECRSILDVNVVGSLQMTRAATRQMIDQSRGGSVVFIGSQTAYHANVLQLAYAASKGALLAAATHLAGELGPVGIRVNTVAPNWMWGHSLEENLTARGVDPHAVVEKVARKLPLRAVVEDSDVAEAVVFLLSERARRVTGQCLLVNAGEYTR